eukprot:6193390-Pleurochrysis_carterae.AAC.3
MHPTTSKCALPGYLLSLLAVLGLVRQLYWRTEYTQSRAIGAALRLRCGDMLRLCLLDADAVALEVRWDCMSNRSFSKTECLWVVGGEVSCSTVPLARQSVYGRLEVGLRAKPVPRKLSIRSRSGVGLPCCATPSPLRLSICFHRPVPLFAQAATRNLPSAKCVLSDCWDGASLPSPALRPAASEGLCLASRLLSAGSIVLTDVLHIRNQRAFCVAIFCWALGVCGAGAGAAGAQGKFPISLQGVPLKARSVHIGRSHANVATGGSTPCTQ